MTQSRQNSISQFSAEVKRLNFESSPALASTDYFLLGRSAHSYFSTSKGLSLLFDAFSMLKKLEDRNIVLSERKTKIYNAMLKNPQIRLEKELNRFLAYSEDDSKQDDPFITEDAKTLIEGLINTHFAKSISKILDPFDIAFWGFCSLDSPELHCELLEKLETIRTFVSEEGLLSAKKLELFEVLYVDASLDLTAYLTKLKEELTQQEALPLMVKKSNDSDTEEVKTKDTASSVKSDQLEQPECPICFDPLNTPSDDHTLQICTHTFHKGCLYNYIQLQIQTNKFPIRCPQLYCKAELTDSDMKSILNETELKQFFTLSVAHFVNKNFQVTFHCPTSDCTYKLFDLDTHKQEITCPLCHRISCASCKELAHFGTPCEVNQFMNVAKALNLKACPSCRHWVERIEGCNHMTCNCGHEFCDRCGQVYDTILAESGEYYACSYEVCELEDYYENLEMLLSLQER